MHIPIVQPTDSRQAFSQGHFRFAEASDDNSRARRDARGALISRIMPTKSNNPLTSTIALFKQAGKDFFEDEALRLAAALAYYASLSLAPLLLVILVLVGIFIDQERVGAALVGQMRGLVGNAGGDIAQSVIEHAGRSDKSGVAAAFGLIVLFLGAGGVFAQLQTAMNVIWEVKAKPKLGIRGFLRKRLLSFSMLAVLAFLSLVSLAASAGLTALGTYLLGALPGSEFVLRILQIAISLALSAGLFVFIFKYLPDVKVRWRDVWIGALITAVLFTVGKTLVGIYLGHSSVGAAYGAAGSIIVLLVWVYYSSLILLFGAEITQVFASRRSAHIRPTRHTTHMART